MHILLRCAASESSRGTRLGSNARALMTSVSIYSQSCMDSCGSIFTAARGSGCVLVTATVTVGAAVTCWAHYAVECLYL
jgi:hypothetical protein